MNTSETLLVVIPVVAIGCVWIVLMVNGFNAEYGTTVNTTTVESFNYNAEAQEQIIEVYQAIIDSKNILIQAFGLVFVGAWQTVLSVTTMINVMNNLVTSLFTVLKIPTELVTPFWAVIFILIVFGLRRLLFKGE